MLILHKNPRSISSVKFNYENGNWLSWFVLELEADFHFSFFHLFEEIYKKYVNDFCKFYEVEFNGDIHFHTNIEYAH